MRKRLFEVIEVADKSDKASLVYDTVMIIVIFASVFPLLFKRSTPALLAINKITVAVFIIDYVLRWSTADFKLGQKGIVPFVKYPFTFMAILDLISVLPSLTPLNGGFHLFRAIRLVRAMRVLRVLKIARYSRNVKVVVSVLKKQKDSLLTVLGFAVAYILVSAILIFNVEPETFDTFFDAVYWATVSLTTVGYGDIYPVSAFGRAVTMLSSLVGIAIVALPASIITAGYMDVLNGRDSDDEQTK